ncbi:MAG TPA: hypothetical protein DIU21_18615, partial [Shigella sp.]|nr:hypothetical protein [Shigella sp.]
KSVELHDNVIGHYLNIKHYQQVGVITGYLLDFFPLVFVAIYIKKLSGDFYELTSYSGYIKWW